MASSPDLFEAYFRRADTDRDGRISGQEAVSFFQGANLSRDVLARIWQYADKGQTGFLSREEFYNALKLVTVAQTGRELTPVLVAKALNGPAALQIPAPQIQYPTAPVNVARPNVQYPGSSPQPSPIQPMAASSSFAKTATATATHVPTPTPMPPLTPPSTHTPKSMLSSTFTPTPVNGAITTRATDWPTTKSSSWSGPASSGTNLIEQPSFSGGKVSLPLQDVLPVNSSYQGGASQSTGALKDTQLDLFGGDVFTAVPTKASSIPTSPRFSQPVSMTNQNFPARGGQTTIRPDPSSLSFTPVPTAVQVPIHNGQQEQGFGSGTDETRTWPKLTDLIIQRYVKIFSEVDTDKDGKISGTQARDLFLSWRLPREVLKQIWDLSDQDRDSMLSLHEFCMALYLMERHREGRVLPVSINAATLFDESGMKVLRISEAQVAVARNSGHNAVAWQQNPSLLQSTGSALPPRPIIHGQPFPQPRSLAQQGKTPVRPSVPTPARDAYGHGLQKSRAPVLEMHNVNQLSADDQLALQIKHQEAVDTEKKVHELEKTIMDSKEKMEFYRTKMQEIVLFKTRCDNRLAEISERAASDKREVESLVQRYDEKFKQAGESQSRLLADETAFRDIQERRLELYNAILRMEQGGDTNALLQARADRLHNDLNELTKALNAKCKQFGLKIKPTSLLELPYGWQPGIQENAAQWDDDWDKFEDEGFTYVQEFMGEGTAGSDAAKPKAPATWDKETQQHDEFDFSSGDQGLQKEESTTNEKPGVFTPGVNHHDKSSTNGDASPQEDSPSHPGHPDSDILTSETDLERHEEALESDAFTVNGGDWASAFDYHKSDGTDSIDSWGRTDASTTEVSEKSTFAFGKNHADASFGYSDPFDRLSNSGQRNKLQEDLPSLEPIRTKERTSVFFDNSVPSTPLNNSSFNHFSTGGFFDDSLPNTPLHSNLASQSQGLNLRFNSFSSATTTDSFSRFDSFNNVAAGQSRDFTAFDETPRHSTDSWNAFN